MTGTATERLALPAAASLAEIVDRAAHLLPEQGPLHTFVHHNTLHAFEHLPFETAVVRAAQLFGTEPFQTEQAFARHLESGRILAGDLEAVIDADLREAGGTEPVGGCSRRDYRLSRVHNLFEIPRGTALDWHLLETDALRAIHPAVDASRRRVLTALADRQNGDASRRERVPRLLQRLWRALEAQAPLQPTEAAAKEPRRRDQLLAIGADDVDQRVHPLLIRLSAAFLDQGVAAWPMPDRELGFLRAVRRLYGLRFPPPDPWSTGLAAEWRRQEEAALDAEATVRAALRGLGIAEARWPQYVQSTLLSLPGWAGMMRQFEVRPDRAPVEPLPARLMEYLAVQLTLDLFAARHALRIRLGRSATWDDLEVAVPHARARSDRELVYEAFIMAQIANVNVDALREPAAAARWLTEARQFDEYERRRILHLAYERRLRVMVLDGLSAHCRQPLPPPPAPRFQAIFCIDERECSTRRHLEETLPAVETFGYAGFFGVAMAWKGLGELRPRPLCPVNVTPLHYVTERALRPEEEKLWLAARRRRGLTTHTLLQSSRMLARGGLVSTIFGLWSVVPMIGRCLFPRLAERLLHDVVNGKSPEPVTRLMLERSGDARDEQGLYIGYSIPEMADVVENALRTIALLDNFCELVLAVGHGSSSLNNPHESAHDCGATGGGRGGPNARAFAAMANHPQVRALLRGRGIDIPESTRFVGAYHNTCDDTMTYYDEELMPERLQPVLEEAKRALEDACALDAHERCRRFQSAPHGRDAAASLLHVEGRAVDLAQPRPEYGHATNAYAIVGRRSRTRGLFLDRRAFLCSYDPATDPDGKVLERLLGAVVPVGVGINLEYYFSYVDPTGYGCGTKLPHNITGLIGIMDGHASDLRTGLPWQMVEIHEPVRLLCVIETEPEVISRILDDNPDIAMLVRNGWAQVVVWSPTSEHLWEFHGGAFRRYCPETEVLPVVPSSPAFYRADSDHLGCARIAPSPVANGQGSVL